MILHNATVDTILGRRSVRSYAPQQITPDELETILEAGRSAPSGMNQQSAIAVAVQSKAELAQLAELAKAAAHQDHNPFYDAPTVILVFARMTNLAPMEDGCTAIENMLLAAKSLGIGTCWIYAVNALFASDAGMAWHIVCRLPARKRVRHCRFAGGRVSCRSRTSAKGTPCIL